MQKVKKHVRQLFLCMILLFSAILIGKQPVLADTLSLSVERFSLGGSFIVEPTEVEFKSGETYETIIKRVLQQKGLTFEGTNGQYGYYLRGINGVDCGKQNMPEAVKAILNDRKMYVGTATSKGLYEFDYTGGSGWMYYVNNKYVDGMSKVKAQDGDATRLMFTLVGGADLTGVYVDSDNKPVKTYFTAGDKSNLLRLMAEANKERTLWAQVEGFAAAYNDAVSVMAKPNATQQEINESVIWLNNIKDKLPREALKGVNMKFSAITMHPGDTRTLAYNTTPSYAAINSIKWRSDNTDVVSVDMNTGKATAKKNGVAKITVVLNDQYTASMTVTVKSAATQLRLDQSSLSLRLDEGNGQLNCTVLPADSATELYWKSSKSWIAYVTNTGEVRPISAGEADITVYNENGLSATCHVTVLPSLKQPFLSGMPSITVKAASSRSVQVSWSAYECAQKYIVYRRTPGAAWTQMAATTGTSYTDNSAQPQTTYYYTVKAISTRWGGELESKYDTNKAVTTPREYKTASVPSAVNRTYNGGWQEGVAAGNGYTLAGTTSAVNAGTYTAWAAPADGYLWPDGTSRTLTLTWSIAKADQAVNTAVAVKNYKMSALKKKAYRFGIYGSGQGAVSYRVTKAPAGGWKYITVDRNGKVTLKKKAPGGVYEIAVTAAGTDNINAAERIVQINVTKNKQKITVKKAKMTYKTKQLKKGNKSYSLKAKAKAGLAYRVTSVPENGWRFISVSKKGKVTVKKNAPKGTYLITVTAKENKNYAAATRMVKLVVK